MTTSAGIALMAKAKSSRTQEITVTAQALIYIIAAIEAEASYWPRAAAQKAVMEATHVWPEGYDPPTPYIAVATVLRILGEVPHG